MSIDTFLGRTFYPRPEARPMAWVPLLGPVKQGVYELLVRLAGAVAGNANEDTANCFLVTGDRGTGKTTVLLSARRAIEHVLNRPKDRGIERFWPKDVAERNETPDERLAHAAHRSAWQLAEARVVWLEILDLLPLPPDTNLLTSLLTRVRDALGSDEGKGQTGALRSLLEEGAEGARSQLAQLINDATLMWEEIHEPDTRNRANRQIAVADTCASFRRRFQTAMDTLAKDLGRRQGTLDAPCPIVLPIDNIDRSTDQLDHIVRLARIVSSRHLWLVLAGERLDVETFLERAYWKELIKVGEGAIATGKKSASGEDEAFTMARRQAAAALHKLLPPSHRVELDLVSPEETLEFVPADRPKAEPKHTIRWLLEQIRVPSGCGRVKAQDKGQADGQSQGQDRGQAQSPNQSQIEGQSRDQGDNQERDAKRGLEFKLIHLFEPLGLLDLECGRHDEAGPDSEQTEALSCSAKDASAQEKEKRRGKVRKGLSFSAKDALRLPARSVLDLWQVAYWASTDLPPTDADGDLEPGESSLAAERIARTMLRTVIAASTLPTNVARCLQDHVIRRDCEGGTVLDFTGVKLLPIPIHAFGFKLPTSCQTPEAAAAAMPFDGPRGVKLFLCSQVESHQIQRVTARFSSKAARIPEIELPRLVTGWLAILYDILLLTERVAIFHPPEEMEVLSNDSIATRHELVTRGPGGTQWRREVTLPWPAPPWDTFLAHDLFTKLWEIPRQALQLDIREGKVPLFPRLYSGMAAMWVACALQVFAILDPSPSLAKERELASARLCTRRDRPLHIDDLCKEPKDLSEPQEGGRGTTASHSTTVEGFEACLEQAEARLFREIGKIYQEIGARVGSGFVARERERVLLEWLERKLPLILSEAYVPFDDLKLARERHRQIFDHLRDAATPDQRDTHGSPAARSRLVEYWVGNAATILAPVDLKLRRLLPRSEIPSTMRDGLEALRQGAGAEPDLEDQTPAAFRTLAQSLGLDPKPTE